MVVHQEWQPLYNDALASLGKEQQAIFQKLAPLDYMVSFVVIVIAHFSNQFNAVVEAALSVARIAPLYSIRASAIDLRRIIMDNLSLLQ